MLNRRLYLQAWLVAVVALLVAFLTLQPPVADVEPEGVATFTSVDAVAAANELAATAPERVPGTEGGRDAADWMQKRLQALPGGDRRVATQDFAARIDGSVVPLRNVYFTVPARAATKQPRNILIIAPRDTPRGVTAGTTSSGILVELARTVTKREYSHPLIFLSVDGGSLGNVGTRWYLNSVQTSLIAGVIVLDAPGEGSGDELHLWASGAGRQTLGLRQIADRAVRSAGFVANPLPPLREQLIRLAVAETWGEQRAAIDAGVPAVTIAGRDESPLPAGPSPAVQVRVNGAGEAALSLINRLDGIERANAPDASLAYAGKILRPSVARLALLLLALPLIVMALDAAARVRRARVRLSVGLRSVGWRFVAPLAMLFLAHVLAMVGVLRPPNVGRPPLLGDLPFGGLEVLVLLLVVLGSLMVWLGVRGRVVALGANPPSEAAGALVWLCIITVVAWLVAPFSLVLILPAAHAALAATVAPRGWQVGLLAVLAAAAPLTLVLITASDLGTNPFTAFWYLFQTSVSGARGLVGPVLAVTVGVCVWSLSTLVAFRARKGLVGVRRPGARPRPAR